MESKTRLILKMQLVIIISCISLHSQNLGNTIFLAGNAISNSVIGGRSIKFQDGIVITKEDTLKGKIMLENSTNFKNGIIFSAGRLSKDSIILVKDILKVIIYKRDSTVVKQSATNFIVVNGEFYRLLFSGKKLELYDKTKYSVEYPGYVGEEFYIIDDSQVKNVGSSAKNSQENIIDYINSRYNKSFTQKYFKSRIDLVNFIVESEKQH